MNLSVRDLNAAYGTSHVLFDVSLDVAQGETVALVGRNGAGKTTTMHAVMGLISDRRGSVRIGDIETIRLPPHRIARAGVGLVPETRRVFVDLTVDENLRTGVKRGAESGHWRHDRIYEAFPLLTKVKDSKAGWLSGGEQQVLSIARTLLGNPSVLLLDEPTEGLAPRIVDLLTQQLLEIKATGLTILLAEQNFAFVTEIADRAYVIDKGVVRHTDTPRAILENDEIRHAYLAV